MKLDSVQNRTLSKGNNKYNTTNIRYIITRNKHRPSIKRFTNSNVEVATASFVILTKRMCKIDKITVYGTYARTLTNLLKILIFRFLLFQYSLKKFSKKVMENIKCMNLWNEWNLWFLG